MTGLELTAAVAGSVLLFYLIYAMFYPERF